MANEIRVNNNVIRRAMTEAYENGNRRMLRESNFTDLGGDAHDWWEYARVVAAMEKASRAWCAEFFKPDSDEKELKRLESIIIDHEKVLFSWVKTEETKAFFHAKSNDGEYIATFADTFLQKKNNVKSEKGFKSEKVHAPATHADFQKKLENHIGTKIAMQTYMSVEEAEYNRKESKFLGKVKSAQAKVDDLNKKIADAEAMAATYPSLKEHSDKMVEQYKKDLADAITEHTNTLESLNDYMAAHSNRRDVEESIEKHLGIISENKAKLEELEKPADKPLDVKAIMHRGLSRLTKDEIMLELRHRKVEFDEKLSRDKLRKVLKGARDAEPVVQEVMEEVAEATVA